MKHLTEFNKYNINELNRDTYDRFISVGQERNDPRGRNIVKNALELRKKQYGGKGLPIQVKEFGEEVFLLDLNPPTKAQASIFEFVITNPERPKVGNFTMEKLFVYYFPDTGKVATHVFNTKFQHLWCYVGKKTAKWLANEINTFLGDDNKITSDKFPQF